VDHRRLRNDHRDDVVASTALFAEHPFSGVLGLQSETLFRQVVGQSLGMGSGLSSDSSVFCGHSFTVGPMVRVIDSTKRQRNRSRQPQARDPGTSTRVEGPSASRIIRDCKTGRSPETVGLIVSNGSQVMEFAPPTEVHTPKKWLETLSRWSLLGGVR
jgi:hypothetical protein